MKIIINMQVYQWCIRTLSSIYDEAFFGKIVIGFQVLSFFYRKISIWDTWKNPEYASAYELFWRNLRKKKKTMKILQNAQKIVFYLINKWSFPFSLQMVKNRAEIRLKIFRWSTILQKPFINIITPFSDETLEWKPLTSTYTVCKSKYSSQMDIFFSLPALHSEYVDLVFKMNKKKCPWKFVLTLNTVLTFSLRRAGCKNRN